MGFWGFGVLIVVAHFVLVTQDFDPLSKNPLEFFFYFFLPFRHCFGFLSLPRNTRLR